MEQMNHLQALFLLICIFSFSCNDYTLPSLHNIQKENPLFFYFKQYPANHTRLFKEQNKQEKMLEGPGSSTLVGGVCPPPVLLPAAPAQP